MSATAPGAKVVLYGSYSRGDFNNESDIDILILVDEEKIRREDKICITYPLYEIELQTGVIITPKVYSKKFWESEHKVIPFYENVNKDGIVI